MTQDIYKKAKNIKDTISKLIDVRDTIINSKSNDLITISSYKLPNYLKDKLISMLDEEINKNESIFESL